MSGIQSATAQYRQVFGCLASGHSAAELRQQELDRHRPAHCPTYMVFDWGHCLHRRRCARMCVRSRAWRAASSKCAPPGCDPWVSSFRYDVVQYHVSRSQWFSVASRCTSSSISASSRSVQPRCASWAAFPGLDKTPFGVLHTFCLVSPPTPAALPSLGVVLQK